MKPWKAGRAVLCVHSHRAVCLLDRDGIPPYRIRKQHRREMQESVQVNGRVPLPHIPVSSRGIAVPSPSVRLGLTSPLGPYPSLLPTAPGRCGTGQWERHLPGFLRVQLTSRHRTWSHAVTPCRLEGAARAA